jgi:hypothetical protein
MRSRWIFFLSLMVLASQMFAAVRSEVADAVMKGNKAVLRTLLQQKADVNVAQVDGCDGPPLGRLSR